jgi:hypothetical protein
MENLVGKTIMFESTNHKMKAGIIDKVVTKIYDDGSEHGFIFGNWGNNSLSLDDDRFIILKESAK